MVQVRFYDYNYYPDLTSTRPEYVAYKNLNNEDKVRILPTFHLGQLDMTSRNIDQAAEAMLDAVEERPFIVDLSKNLAPTPFDWPARAADERTRSQAQARYDREQGIKDDYDAELARLTRPHDGFAEWRNLVRSFRHAVPVIQFTNPATQSQAIVRQAVLLATNDQSIAIRITPTNVNELMSIIYYIFPIVANPSRVLFILDSGQARSRAGERETFAANTMAQIAAMLDERQHTLLRFVHTSGSFPQLGHTGEIERDNIDRSIWNNLSVDSRIRYGDYGSMYRVVPNTTFRLSGFRASTTLPLAMRWVAYRSPNANDPGGWQECAANMARHDEFATTPECWGKVMARNAAAGDTSEVEASKHWIAARINWHIKTQLDFGEELANLGDVF